MRERATADQIRHIKTLQRAAGLDDDAYRGLLMGQGATSSKDLTLPQAASFIDILRDLAPTSRRPSTTASGRYAPILQALWIAGYNLGVVRVADDAALIAFVQRQCKVDHTRFLTDRDSASPAIEALKKWIAREAGVVWPKGRDRDPLAMKRAVLEAQWRRLIALGAVTAFGPPERLDGLQDYVSAVTRGGARRLGSINDPSVTPQELDRAAAALGKKLRKALAARTAEATGHDHHKCTGDSDRGAGGGPASLDRRDGA